MPRVQKMPVRDSATTHNAKQVVRIVRGAGSDGSDDSLERWCLFNRARANVNYTH